ncbi:translation initiation factor IF-2 [Candidatus Gracilibacteria bacterium]|nr:translation initiation factor IF-2 [Candidatus Gracilibacteria bacterium]
MSVSLSDLSKKFNVPAPELIEKLKALGITVGLKAKSIDEDAAALLELELQEHHAVADKNGSPTTGIEETFEKEREREIIKSQRKMTAGKDARSKKHDTRKRDDSREPKEIEIPDTISVKEFSEKTGMSPVRVIGELMKNGILANINQTIDYDTALIIADDFGIKLKRRRTAATIEDISMGNIEMLTDEKDTALLSTRPPVVTIMGHVDHGKTSLLDAIRETHVTKGEAGGITQHIGAYQVVKNGKKISFIDTPGHEAFTSMRARGARITDIVILVVAADEGIKPQTTEALNHALEAEVPIIVALNKIDKEGANVDRVKAQLAEAGLQPEDWGGKTIMVPVSAVTGEGIPLLLEMILLVAEVENLRANPTRPAVATVLESHLDKSMGPVATIIVNTGTLKSHDTFIVGSICGRVKIMRNDSGVSIKEAPPSTPVLIAGLESTPTAGDILQVVGSMEEAHRKAEQISTHRSNSKLEVATTGLENIMSAIQAGQLKTLKVVVKADTLGTMEALKLSLAQVKKDEVAIKIIHSAVGPINESDVVMAAASGGIVVGFNTEANPHVHEVAYRNGVKVFTYKIIYKLIEDLKKILSGLLLPQEQEVILGQAEIRQIFLTERKYVIIGCKITSGKMENKAKARVIRDGKVIGEGVIASLKRINDPVHELGEGNDCGIKFETDVKLLQEKDIIEAWKMEQTQRIVT